MVLFDKVAILGTGLLGASLAWALKDKALVKNVSIWSRSKSSRDICASKSWCDEVFDSPQDAVKNADLVVIATVPDAIANVLEQVSNSLKSGAIVSDVGSTKFNIVNDCEKILENTDATFVGSHPMAGSDKSGAQAAKVDLFENAMCFVCPSKKSKEASNKIVDMWKHLGMNVFLETPERHDEIVARVSHLPQCVSSALALLASENLEDFSRCAGNGFRDTTRIAKSDVAMWESIIAQNSENISENLGKYIEILQNLKCAIDEKDSEYIKDFFTSSRTTRLKLDK